ncbi:FecR family protein [Chitinophaga sp. HK235]|uniref:FecR family protein n=1 Tax=Chitinophaga sp. HK235 TaxID=2952571 RepID=UPI001BA7658C|nr:FecR family protein [Chitinophaga sp. HK235]
MEAKEYYRFLLQRYYEGSATAAEEEELFAELGKHADDEAWVALMDELHAVAVADPQYNPAEYEPVLQGILQAGESPKVHRIAGWRRWAAAAVLLFSAGGYYWWQHGARNILSDAPVAVAADVLPGKNGAVLTLANGQQVVLDSHGDGLITSTQGTQVILKNGQVEYKPSGNGTPVNNTLHTPRGRKFRMQLPDGTQVWLNAASSLSFPTAFTGTERKVELTGEAYFEVAKDQTKPFVVSLSNNTSVKVLGTHFDISAYTDEPGISTTLLEGAVQVNVPEHSSTLKPGQQLLFNKNAGTVVLNKNIDTAAVMAWKNGVLSFQDKKLTAVIAMIARWYDIEVTYATTPPDITFVGEIGSDVNLSSVLTFLRESGIQFNLEGRKLIIGKQ